MILALLAVAALGALSLMGNSVSGLLASFSPAAVDSPVLTDMAHLRFNGSESNNGQKTFLNSTQQAGLSGESLTSMESNRITNSGGRLFVGEEGPNGGVNATSVDGDKKLMENTAFETLAYAKRLQEVADNLPEGSEKLWLTHDVIPRLLSLAAAEGYAAKIPSLQANIKSKSYTNASALKDIATIQSQLIYKTDRYSYVTNHSQGEIFANPSPQLAQQVRSILHQAIQGTETFVPKQTNKTTISWDIDILKAYGGNMDLAVDAMSENPGYQEARANVKRAQADGSIKRSAPTERTAKGADTLEDVVRRRRY